MLYYCNRFICVYYNYYGLKNNKKLQPIFSLSKSTWIEYFASILVHQNPISRDKCTLHIVGRSCVDKNRKFAKVLIVFVTILISIITIDTIDIYTSGSDCNILVLDNYRQQ